MGGHAHFLPPRPRHQRGQRGSARERLWRRGTSAGRHAHTPPPRTRHQHGQRGSARERRGRTVAQNMSMLVLSNFAERVVGSRLRLVALGPFMIIMAVGTMCLECTPLALSCDIHMCMELPLRSERPMWLRNNNLPRVSFHLFLTARILLRFTWYAHLTAKQRTRIRYHMLLECGSRCL
jgi:hypothetical protein